MTLERISRSHPSIEAHLEVAPGNQTIRDQTSFALQSEVVPDAPTARDQSYGDTHKALVASDQTTRGHLLSDDHPLSASGEPVSIDQRPLDAQSLSVDGTSFQPATVPPQPKREPLAAELLGGDQKVFDTPVQHVAANSFPPAKWKSSPTATLLAGSSSESTTKSATPMSNPSMRNPLYDSYLCLVSDTLDDLEQLRIATENRVRTLTRSEVDSDGEIRGFGLGILSAEVFAAVGILARLRCDSPVVVGLLGKQGKRQGCCLEHDAERSLTKALRKHPIYGTRHPLYDFIEQSKGIGAKQGARLLAVIGDPYWNDLYDRPRTVSELWAYCGYSVVLGRAQRRTKGVKSNWNDKAKSRAFLIAQQCVIAGKGGKYNALYYAIKDKSVGAIHEFDCVRCGPAGKPALVGSPLSDGHRDARAKRAVAKEILKDLWLQARQVHTGEVAEPSEAP